MCSFTENIFPTGGYRVPVTYNIEVNFDWFNHQSICRTTEVWKCGSGGTWSSLSWYTSLLQGDDSVRQCYWCIPLRLFPHWLDSVNSKWWGRTSSCCHWRNSCNSLVLHSMCVYMYTYLCAFLQLLSCDRFVQGTMIIVVLFVCFWPGKCCLLFGGYQNRCQKHPRRLFMQMSLLKTSRGCHGEEEEMPNMGLCNSSEAQIIHYFLFNVLTD